MGLVPWIITESGVAQIEHEDRFGGAQGFPELIMVIQEPELVIGERGEHLLKPLYGPEIMCIK